MSIHWPIIRTLLRNPRRALITDDKGDYSGLQILVAAMHVAAVLRGKCESSTVGVLVPTSGAFPICALAGWMLGKTVVPLNYLLKPEELQYVIDDCECDTIVTVQAMLDFLPQPPKFTARFKHLIRLDDIAFKSFPEPVFPAQAQEEDLAVMLYTSGTSGKPKGVMLTHGNLCANLNQIRAHVELFPTDIALGVLPQFHSFGMTVLTLLPLTVGFRAVYAARFMPHRIVKLMREHRPTLFIAIPSMYNALLALKDATTDDFSSFRYVVSGGEPLPNAVFDRMRERFGVTLCEGYGLTETAPVSNWCRGFEFRQHSVGKALPGITQRIVDTATGRTLGPTSDGEVQMRGPNVMRGYFKLPQETANAFTADGFFRTGDIGHHDRDGHLMITGRLKEMLIVGGENVFPREIEEVLNQHPTVNASGVVGLTDPMRGEVPIAFVEPRDEQVIEPATLIRWCRERLAGYKVPHEIRVLPQLPRNPTGKVMRRELKKELE